MKTITVNFQRVEYGFAEIEVPDNATEEEILDIADDAERNGKVFWNDDIVTLVDYDENKIKQNKINRR